MNLEELSIEVGGLIAVEMEIRKHTARDPKLILLPVDTRYPGTVSAVYGIPVRYLAGIERPLICYEGIGT